jgi:two-component system, sensor histidine kinase
MMRATPLVLNVDDDDTMRYVKTRILRGAGFEVLEAPDGATAMRLLHERGPDLVLMDVKLPDADGRELAKRIKADPDLAKVVVLQTSASHVDSRHRVASLEAGADGYLVEPMEPEELVANVRALLRMRRAEHELKEALEKLREADRRKDEFLAMLAHELRNPLAPIRNGVEILKSDDAEVRERARRLIGRQVAHMTRLVDDLLEVSRITQGKVALQRQPMAVTGAVEAAVETVRLLAEAKAQVLEVHVEPDLWIDADVVRMAQVLGNLLQNAVKFTPEKGRITLRAQAVGAQVVLSVRDNGMGIPASVLPHVFDLFAQGDRSLDRAQGGLGIGLSLVRALAEMHGGSVEAHSEGVGRGSVFTLRIPRSTPSAAPAAVAASLAPLVARRILVVEDNPDAAEAMLLLLRAAGHQVTVLNDGAAAVAVARELRPQVVLLDIGLPGLDGYTLARTLRGLEETRAARIIAVSGYGQPGDRQRSMEAGFDMHLVKPVDPERLAEAIQARA